MKNIILKTTAGIAIILFIISGCALDSESWLPFVICLASIAYLTAFAYANKLFYGMGNKQ